MNIISSLLERASQLVQHKRFQDAEKSLREILSQEPDNAESITLLAICKSETGNHKESLDLIRQAVSQQPDNDYFLYLNALFLLQNDNINGAEKMILNAIAFNPNQADYFGLLSTINLNQKEWDKALDNANKGLEIDGENLSCLNVRSNALFKLDRKEDAFSTIAEALQQDPENDYTHANVGWGLLEKGDHKKALEHFSEALKINPQNAFAKAGLVEGLKARYWFYRIFLKYSFWVANMKSKGQWALIIGMYIGVRILRAVASSNPTLAVFIAPIVYAYFAFAISTWLIEPLSNLFLRLNVYGRYALTAEETKSSSFVGISLLIGLFGGLMFLLTGEYFMLLTLFYGLMMMVPLGSMFNASTPGKKKVLIGYTIGLAAVGIVAILQAATTGVDSPFVLVFAVGIFLYQWVANALIIR